MFVPEGFISTFNYVVRSGIFNSAGDVFLPKIDIVEIPTKQPWSTGLAFSGSKISDLEVIIMSKQALEISPYYVDTFTKFYENTLDEDTIRHYQFTAGFQKFGFGTRLKIVPSDSTDAKAKTMSDIYLPADLVKKKTEDDAAVTKLNQDSTNTEYKEKQKQFIKNAQTAGVILPGITG